MKKMSKRKKLWSRILLFALCVCMIAPLAKTDSEAASKKVINYNVSSSEVTTNATKGSIPTGVSTVSGNNSYYFNFQTSSDMYVTSAALYVKAVGESGYTRVYREVPKNYLRYTSYNYTFANSSGTVSYYWKIDYYTSSSKKVTSKKTSVKSVTVKKSSTSTLPTSLYLKQSKSTTCTLAATAMMMRARMYKSGNSTWSTVTESAIKSTAWTSSGLKWSFTYTTGDKSKMTIAHTSYSGISLSKIKSLLKSHPEGIVLYCGKMPHAVYITRVSGDTIYCADPVSGYSGKEIKLSASSLGKKYGSQAKVLSNVTAVWYISSYSIK